MQYSYEEVISTIENSRRFGKHTGFEVSLHILEKLGHPENGLPFVHVAGTNGKGSTTAFLCKILEQTGKKIGMFTSPHLVDFGERIRINGVQIPKEEITRIGNLLLNTEFDPAPTMFDYCLAMAALYFKEQGCDIAVMETGIGGRYDSTNALGIPMVSVITKIGFDHTAVLGNTLAEIAGEKAGIMKKGAPVVTQRQEPEAAEVLWQNFLQTGQEADKFICVTEADIKKAAEMEMQMKGSFQLENAATAIHAAEIVFMNWESIEEHADVKDSASQKNPAKKGYSKEQIDGFIRKGIKETIWKGRMEVLKESPFLMVDGAHNGHGVQALAEGLKDLYPGEKFHFIMGVMADKDYENMIEELLPLAIDFTTVTPESSRALQAKELAECIAAKGIPATHGESVKAVMEPFLEGQSRTGKTIAFGSLYFIGEIEGLFYAFMEY